MYVKKKLNNCIEEIAKLFLYDSLVLLDCVLEDDPIDPKYSANTVCNRLEKCLLFQKLYYQDSVMDLSDFLIKKGYSQEDIELLKIKQEEENDRFS